MSGEDLFDYGLKIRTLIGLRKHLIEKYCASELKEYRRIFRVTDEVSRETSGEAAG